ncbi:MAG: sigma 54-interacting transcriptional regulator [Candidatus Lernaella stagnicola]|nr:sigma 54-interacting transcriptional regulator [Candidatus Lernaella stagnicola]
MALLIITKASGSEQCVPLVNDTLVIGREPACDVILSDTSVSRRHAVIARREGHLWLEDLGSKNGTLLDGRPVDRIELTTDAAIEFGDVHAMFALADNARDAVDQPVREETIVGRRGNHQVNSVDLGFLTELAEAAATREDPRDMAETVMAVIQRQLNCENVYLGLCDAQSGDIRRHFQRRAPEVRDDFAYSQAIVDKAIAQRAAVLVRDAADSRHWRRRESVLSGGIRSVLCVPLIAAGRVEGVLYADTRSHVREFTGEDLALAGAVAPLLGAIFRNLQAVRALRNHRDGPGAALNDAQLIGRHEAITEVRRTLAKFASKGDAPVLIEGESGTGKELAARTVHQLSDRAAKPFLEVNCAAVPRELMESELFGHVKGAFTSAVGNRRGLFELASGGTLLLDELGELPFELQAKLLRVLETGSFRPIGAEAGKRVNVRIVAATNRNLHQMVEDGSFRRDLYFRLNVLFIRLPALREHPEDIPELAGHFLKLLSDKISTRVTGFDEAAMAKLVAHPWPGNGRELKNVIERALYACEGRTIQTEDLVGLTDGASGPTAEQATPADRIAALENELRDAERDRIREALERHRWNRTQAAKELGISRKTLIAKIKLFDLR